MLADLDIEPAAAAFFTALNGTTPRRIDVGLYENCAFNFHNLVDFRGDEETWKAPYRFKDDDMPSYGVVDSIEQFLGKFGDALRSSPNDYAVGFTAVRKCEQPATGGWRWHKWGEYFGVHRPQCEYLYNEPDVAEVVTFSVLRRVRRRRQPARDRRVVRVATGGDMNLSIRRLKSYESAERGLVYSCDLLLDSTVVARCEQPGGGEPTQVHWRRLAPKAEILAYCTGLPAETVDGKPLKHDLESVIARLCDEFETAQKIKQLCRRCLVFCRPSEPGLYYSVRAPYTATLAEALRHKHGQIEILNETIGVGLSTRKRSR